MDTANEATSNLFTVGQTGKKTQSELKSVLNPEGSSKEDEDFLSEELSPEEKECLEYLLQTINALDGDLSEDNEERQEKAAESLDTKDQRRSRVDSSTPQSTSVEATAEKPGPCPVVSNTKTTKSLSEDSGNITQSRPDSYCSKAKGPPRSDSRTADFRKFDTIMRSGVNVQELRSRFLLHLESTAAAREQTGAATATIRQPVLLPGGQKSPRDEALQKLGLHKRHSSFPNMNSPQVPSGASQEARISLAERLDCKTALSSIGSTGESVHAHPVAPAQDQTPSQQELITRKS